VIRRVVTQETPLEGPSKTERAERSDRARVGRPSRVNARVNARASARNESREFRFIRASRRVTRGRVNEGVKSIGFVRWISTGARSRSRRIESNRFDSDGTGRRAMRFVRFTPIVRVAFYPVDARRFPSLPVASRPVVVVVIDEPRR
jgi:hypothetical protein